MDIALKWLTLLHNPEDIVEIRSIDPKPVISGYFKADSAAIAKEIARFPNRTFYQTLQMVQPACYARGQHEHLMERPRETTSDNDIAGYQWILVDTDPVRPSGVSASQPEKEAARKVSATVMKKLMALGFKEPIVADSGNGYHLLFKIHASTDDRQIIADFLSVLDMWFSTNEAKIDTSVFNPARITKLYGTMTHKGANTQERPHRASRIIRMTGKITASNQSLSVSGSSYIGTVTLTTDADLIRIPRSVGTLTGNSGGSDGSYYYVRSGDTIRVTSSSNRFAVTMESVSSDDEEAKFLVGVPSVAIQKIMVPIYGAPYALKIASVTFELSTGEIKITKKSSDGILLQGASFELLGNAGSVLATATTGTNGVAVFEDLMPGTYTVREKNAPQGYALSASSSQSVTVAAGMTTNVAFVNDRVMGRIRIVKTDKLTGKPLSGAVFSITRLSGPVSDNASDVGKVVATVTTNAQGIAETGLLPWGEYKVVETGVPDGYLDSGYATTVWIK